MTAGNVYRQVPDETLSSIPRGNVTAASLYDGIKLLRPGWRMEFRKAMEKITYVQQRAITKMLGVGEVFPGVT